MPAATVCGIGAVEQGGLGGVGGVLLVQRRRAGRGRMQVEIGRNDQRRLGHHREFVRRLLGQAGLAAQAVAAGQRQQRRHRARPGEEEFQNACVKLRKQLSGRVRMLGLEHFINDRHGAQGNGDVGDIEHIPVIAEAVKVEKIGHPAIEQPVDQVSRARRR